MLVLPVILVFIAGVLLVIGIKFKTLDKRPSLKLHDLGGVPAQFKKKEVRVAPPSLLRVVSVINKPLVTAEIRQQFFKNMAVGFTPEEFFLIKELMIVLLLALFIPVLGKDQLVLSILIGFAGGWSLPDFWMRAQIQGIKDQIVRQLPDTVDLLGLCVNAGLDFMMALKWVVEKSAPCAFVGELNNVLQEINVGKPRRDALRDLAKKYDLPDLSTFARTLIQADKMGTSVSEALNILSEDMRLARFRRGEAMALKAPLKMLFPLLFCIFPVVGILVGAPIFLDFMYNNPMKSLGTG
jgi:pilus assembly protein TadC